MFKNFINGLIVVVISFGAVSCSGEGDINYGSWEITDTQILADGSKGQSQSAVLCLTKENILPSEENLEANGCKPTKMTLVGNKAIWAADCEATKGVMKRGGEFIFDGDTFKGSTFETLPELYVDRQITMSGIRLGDCREPTPRAKAGY